MTEKYKFPNKLMEGQFIKYIPRSEITGILGSLGNTLSIKYKDQELILICVLKGAVIFLADLIREIKNVKLYVDFVSINSIGHERESHGTISLNKDLSCDVFDKNVLIVEEIIDSGRSLNFLKKRIELSAPKSLEILTLFDKPNKRLASIYPNFIGKKLPDQFIVGYGLDLEEYGRNLEDIYFLKYPN